MPFFEIDPAPEKPVVTSTRFWMAILYPENMVDNWEDIIADTLQIPIAYCRHDTDFVNDGDARKDHIHLIEAFSNTTTWNHARNVANLLSKSGKRCCSTVQPVIKIQQAYAYLIHDTDDARKAGKHLYPESSRICKNGFDIGAYIQLDAADKEALICEIEDLLYQECICQYSRLNAAIRNLGPEYHRVLRENSSHFNRLCVGMYQEQKIENRN